MTDILAAGPEAGPVLMLAHGAGAAMTSPFMELIAGLLADRGLATARFEFAYMAARRGGKRRPPPKAETLLPEYDSAIEVVRQRWPQRPILIGGKSMGGRVASLLAARAFGARRCVGLVCLGYPFHPPDKPAQLRTGHLMTLSCQALIVQGERDPFGARVEIEAMSLPANIAFHWAGDGDHDLAPRAASGFTRRGNLAAATDAIVGFAKTVA